MTFFRKAMNRLGLPLAALSLVGGMIVSGVAADKTEPVAQKPTPEPSPAPSAAPARAAQDSGCISNASAIEDIRSQREALETSKKALSLREEELKAREAALTEELKKLEAIRDEIARTEARRTQESEERVTRLVELLETMNPRAGSQMLATLDEELAVRAMGRLAPQKLAKLMNVMDAGRSSHLAERMAGVVRARRAETSPSNGGAEATPKSTKGGEENVGQNANSNKQVVRSTNGQSDGGSGGSAGSGEAPVGEAGKGR